MNADCKKPISSKTERNIDKNHANHGIGFYIAIMIVVIIPPIIIGLAMNNSTKPPVYSISGRTFSISTEFGKKVDLSNIKSVQLKNNPPKIGSKLNGLGLGNTYKGEYSSDIGDITLYVNTDITQYVYIETTSGLIILNDQSVAKTQALYNELNMDINNKQNE
ncbi:MAG TPA: hypothetical protein VN426_00015 [Syntrophomonadaceae bacterium]|nr:hypothetical protein [Syntrophomonadaceae bacterium]